MRPKSVKKY